MTCVGTRLSCPRCGHERRKAYVPVDFLNEAHAERDRLSEGLRQTLACMEWCVNLGADEQTAKSLRRGIEVGRTALGAAPLNQPETTPGEHGNRRARESGT